METNILLLIILIVIYLGVGYISTLVIDTSEKRGHHATFTHKIFSIFLWPIIMIFYFFTDFDGN